MDAKETNINIRISYADREMIRQGAEEYGLSVSAYIIYLAKRDLRKREKENGTTNKEDA